MTFSNKAALTGKLYALENTHAETGELPLGEDPVALGLRAHFVQWDARLLEAIVMRSDLPGLFQLRSYLFRGRASEAQSAIENMESECSDPKDLSELAIEKARLSVINGDWHSVIQQTIEASRLSPSPVSHLSLLQIQALALFETGDFVGAKRNLEKVDSLSRFLPRCSASFYAKILMLRIVAREQSVASARSGLNGLIDNLQERRILNRNHLQTFLRTEVDFLRLENRMHFREAIGSLILAEAAGEKLYAALAAVDCLFSGNLSEQRELSARVSSEKREFLRIKKIFEELGNLDADQVSTSVQALRNFRHPHNCTSDEPTSVGIKFIIFTAHALLIDVDGSRISDLKSHGKLVLAIIRLSDGVISKTHFFNAVWGPQRYRTDLHDGIIYSLLYRLKKKCGVETKIENGLISLLTPIYKIGEGLGE